MVSLFPWGVKQMADAQTRMISVERVLEYCDIKSETDFATDARLSLSKSWPEKGDLIQSNILEIIKSYIVLSFVSI